MPRLFRRTLCALLLLLFPLACFARPYTVSKRVLLPDNTPAVGALVTARTYTADSNHILAEVVGQTDADGNFSVNVELVRQAMPGSPAGHLIIDMPGCALCFFEIPGMAGNDTIKLTPAYTLSGTVIDADNHPMVNATVMINYLNTGTWIGVRTNGPSFGIITPQLMTQTDAAGVFSLRGMKVTGGYFHSAFLSATVTQDGHILAGYMESVPFRSPADKMPTRPDAPVVITVQPTVEFSGTICDEITKAPLPGATVQIMGEPNSLFTTTPTVTTDARGCFTLTGVPNTGKLTELIVTKAQYASSRKDLRTGDGLPVTAFLAPIARVNVTVVDAATGQAPLLPVSVMWPSTDAADLMPKQVLPGETLTATVAAGTVTFGVYGGAYQGKGQCVAGPATPGSCVVQLTRQPGVLLKFVAATPDALAKVILEPRGPDGKTVNARFLDASGLNYLPTKFWGDTVTIRLVRQVSGKQPPEELLPWTDFIADEKNWPLTIQVP